MTILISSHHGIEMFMEEDETKETVCYNFTDIKLSILRQNHGPRQRGAVIDLNALVCG